MWILLSLLACTGEQPVELPEIVPGAPVAGAAEGTIDLPIGTPLGGFSARCSCLSGQSRQDKRDSPYQTRFVESTGIHTRPTIKAVWLENGDDALVLVKADLIYSNDKLVGDLSARLGEITGVPLEGRVVITTNHSHNSYGPFSDQFHFYLGGDYYNEEIYQRLLADLVEVAEDAWESREPAAIGTGWAKDWDPSDRVYRDRRGVNNDLVLWDEGDLGTGKDPWLNVVRIDATDGSPIALLYTFGIHGISLGEGSPMISGDAPGAVEFVLQESFDEPVVVMHMQGAGGDASPAGSDSGYARLETIGEYATGAIMDLWEQVPTSDAPIRLETASRHVWQYRDQLRVTRDGTVDWTYAPQGEKADNVVYADDGSILSPIDEFDAPYGAAFCGSGDFELPVGGLGVSVEPYSACMDVELLSRLIAGFFYLEPDAIPIPMPESYKAGTSVTRFGPLATLDADGTTTERDLLVGFFPAEPTAMYAEQWRRRVKAELGYEMPLLVGYAQDHEGYFLLAEDWLMGGYEPNIAIWGPLQAEHVMEEMLAYSDDVLGSDVRELEDLSYATSPTLYPEHPLPEIVPDPTPDAGTLLEEPPEYLWVPDGRTVDLVVPAEVPRVQGIVQLAWRGGDAMVDIPRVVLERMEGEDWVEVKSASGRSITDDFADILMGYTPDPLYPFEEEQTHTFWAGWQAVGHVHDRAGLPLGTYRLKVDGVHWVGDETTWPWTTEPYEVASDPFELVPAAITVEPGDDGIWASIDAPAEAWRLVDLEGSSTGSNPLRGTVTVTVEAESGTESHEVDAGDPVTERTLLAIDLPDDVTAVTVTDGYGNTGTWVP